jgi:hypothetical protein
MTENKLTEVLVGGDQRSAEIVGTPENLCIIDARLQFRDVDDIVAVLAKVINDRALNSLVTNEIQAASSDVG